MTVRPSLLLTSNCSQARPGSRIKDAFPPDHIRGSVAGMLRKVGAPPIGLVQFHVWQDDWADDAAWQDAEVRFLDNTAPCSSAAGRP